MDDKSQVIFEMLLCLLSSQEVDKPGNGNVTAVEILGSPRYISFDNNDRGNRCYY